MGVRLLVGRVLTFLMDLMIVLVFFSFCVVNDV